MPRQKAFIGIFGLLVLLVGACSTQSRAPVPSPPTPIAINARPYDGRWIGEETSNDGRPISVSFTVRSGGITSFTCTYPGISWCSLTVIDSTVRILNLAHRDVFALTTALVTSLINISILNLGCPSPAVC